MREPTLASQGINASSMHELPRKWTALPATQPRLLLPSLARLGDLLRGFQRFEFCFLRIERRRLIVRAAENAAIPGRWPAMGGEFWTARGLGQAGGSISYYKGAKNLSDKENSRVEIGMTRVRPRFQPKRW